MARPDYEKGLSLRDDALRFTRGNPSYPSVYLLDSALAYLGAYRMEDVEAYVVALTKLMIEGVNDMGISTSTPSDSGRYAASVCIDTQADTEIMEALRNEGIFVWGGRGRIRFSFHAYNSEAEVKRALHVLLPIWKRVHDGVRGPA